MGMVMNTNINNHNEFIYSYIGGQWAKLSGSFLL